MKQGFNLSQTSFKEKMLKKEVSKNEWFLVSIEDPFAVAGTSILKVITLVNQIVNFNFFIVDDILGFNSKDWIIFNLRKKMNHIMKMRRLDNILPFVTQFEWGDFFLFKEYPTNWVYSQEYDYPQLISQTDTTIRAIDNTYIYVYTPSEQIVKILKEN